MILFQMYDSIYFYITYKLNKTCGVYLYKEYVEEYQKYKQIMQEEDAWVVSHFSQQIREQFF